MAPRRGAEHQAWESSVHTHLLALNESVAHCFAPLAL